MGRGCWGSSPRSVAPDPVTSPGEQAPARGHGAAGGKVAPAPMPWRSPAWQAPTWGHQHEWNHRCGSLGQAGTALALPGSPHSAGQCCWDNVFPIAVSPAPLQSKPPAAARLQPISSRLPNKWITRHGLATACRGTTGRDRQLPLPGANLRLALPAAPACAGWSPSHPHPGPLEHRWHVHPLQN